MKYLRKFENHADYEAATLDLPNVSYCVQLNEVHYNPGEYDLYPYSAILNPTNNFTQVPKVTIFSDKPIYSQREYAPIIYFEDTYGINFTYSNDSYYGNNAAFMEPNSNYTINVNYPNGIIKAISGVTGYKYYYYKINEDGIEFDREVNGEPL